VSVLYGVSIGYICNLWERERETAYIFNNTSKCIFLFLLKQFIKPIEFVFYPTTLDENPDVCGIM